MSTLDDVLISGRGIERPFQCPVHEGDNPASASVNVLKGVWYCYVCAASGNTDGKGKAPSAEALALMIEPEKVPRRLAESTLDLYDVPPRWRTSHYWAGRFPEWLVWHARLGQDPFSDDATFPVRTPRGVLAGLGRRRSNESVALAEEQGTNPSRYLYPRSWSASRTLHGWPNTIRGEILVLVEGAADAISLWEIGVPALAHYGSGLHYPQAELVRRANPPLVLLGQDKDDPGHKGALRSRDTLGHDVPTSRVLWPGKDPGDCSPDERRAAVLEAVRGSQYGLTTTTEAELLDSWNTRLRLAYDSYTAHLESL